MTQQSQTTPAVRRPAPGRKERVAKALGLFRVMAFLVGVGLLLLVVEMVLKYGFGNDVLAWWATPHGFLYMIYIGVVFNLSSAARIPLAQTIGIMLAGVVPFLSFWAEHKVTQKVRAKFTL